MTVLDLDESRVRPNKPTLSIRMMVLFGMAACAIAPLGGCKFNKLFAKKGEDVTFETPSGKAVPRWEMLKSDKANARLAPSADSPILFVFRKPSLPLQVISETREYRLVCDPSGRAVWLNATLLRSSNRVINMSSEPLSLLKAPKSDAHVWAHLKPMSMASIDTCEDGWCRLQSDKEKGWAPEDKLWGRQTTPVCSAANPLTAPVIPLRQFK